MQLSVILKKPDGTHGYVNTNTILCNSVKDMAEIILREDYCVAVYAKNYRNNENFLSTELIILDYDNSPEDIQVSLEQARATFAPYKHIIATTRNHQKVKGDKPAADRFRVVLFLASPITDVSAYYPTWKKVADMFPGCDDKCKDPARMMFQSRELISLAESGATISVESARATVKQERASAPLPEGTKGRVSRATRAFMLDGAKPGAWNASLFKAAKDYHEQGYTQGEFEKAAALITGHLDASDHTTINSAFKKAPKYDPRDPTSEEAIDLPPVERWALEWLTNNNVTQNYQTSALMMKGKEVGADLIISRMVLDAIAYALANPTVNAKGDEKFPPPYTQANIEHALGLWMDGQDKVNLATLRANVAHVPGGAGRPLINQWVKAVTGREDEKDVAVMTHFIWQVKRKLHGYKAEWHMMPIIYGPTGSGKTEAVKALLAPIEQLTVSPQDMAVLGDSREATIFTRFYVAFFDELARADKVDVSALKNKITCDHITHRKLGTNIQITKKNVCTFIGASNNHVQSIIQDPTSARRFWQIESSELIDWQTINTIDYKAMWESVSESEAAPIISVLADVSAVQNNELRAKSLVEQWLTSHTEPCQVGVASAKAYESFQEWCAWQQIRTTTTHTTFGLELQRLGYGRVRRNTGSLYLIKLKT